MGSPRANPKDGAEKKRAPTTEKTTASATLPKATGRSDFNLVLLSLVVLVVASFVGESFGGYRTRQPSHRLGGREDLLEHGS